MLYSDWKSSVGIELLENSGGSLFFGCRYFFLLR